MRRAILGGLMLIAIGCAPVVPRPPVVPTLPPSPPMAATGPDLRHPDLDAAINNIKEAVDNLREAEQKHHFDTAGHAAKAKELLAQAAAEIAGARAFMDGKEGPAAK